MDLSRFPRRRYTDGPTPIQRLDRFSAALGPGGPTVYIKRDDMLGLAGGGNKARKLEFLVADALAQGADTLITCGGVQSNHCRLTMSAAAVEGMHGDLVLTQDFPGDYRQEAGGNIQLFHLLGTERIHALAPGADVDEAMALAAQIARDAGQKPYAIGMGGSSALGVLGYVACAQEILEQQRTMGVEWHQVVVAVGSTGTLDGLVLGFAEAPRLIPVLAICVLAAHDVAEARARKLLKACVEQLPEVPPLSSQAMRFLDDYLGPGYAKPTRAMCEAVALLARTEGILLDPTYTGKAMAGLVDLARKGQLAGQNVLFLHTGGSPGLYAHPEYFQDLLR